MVCHETYKDQNNNWVSPEEIINIDGEKFLKQDKNQKNKNWTFGVYVEV